MEMFLPRIDRSDPESASLGIVEFSKMSFSPKRISRCHSLNPSLLEFLESRRVAERHLREDLEVEVAIPPRRCSCRIDED